MEIVLNKTYTFDLDEQHYIHLDNVLKNNSVGCDFDLDNPNKCYDCYDYQDKFLNLELIKWNHVEEAELTSLGKEVYHILKEKYGII
jgi:hypothetical protein